MLEFYWSEGLYIVVDTTEGIPVDSFANLDDLLEEYPDAVEM